jgi:4-carboxymuconolactone decarboxylase
MAVSSMLAGMTVQAWGADASTPPAASRFPPLTLDQLNVDQPPLGGQIMRVSSIGLGAPHGPLLRSPVFGQRMFDLRYYLRWNSSVPLRLNEFAILIVGRQRRSQVEWFAHGSFAITAALSAEVVADLKAQNRPGNMKLDEAVVYDFVTELSTTHQVSESTFARAKQVLGDSRGSI